MGHETPAFFPVITGLDPAIHVSPQDGVRKQWLRRFHGDARVERGHDGGGVETA
jgi:hypothetical protein